MEKRKSAPIGIELVRRGLITQQDIDIALEYQRTHPNKKMGDIISELNLCNQNILIDTIAELMGEKGIYLTMADVKINSTDYMALDIEKQYKAIPFDISNGRIKVCFADVSNKRVIESVRLLLLNKGLVMDRYLTFEKNIMEILNSMEGEVSENIDLDKDVTSLIDNIIKTGILKRASDIHIEPLGDSVRVRYRIDGELFTVANIPSEKQSQIIGRLKAISNMHQEKQEAQDGRILLYPNYNIRVSSQKNVNGEKFVLRLLKKKEKVEELFELGFPQDKKTAMKTFNKKNSITIVAAPTGEGKTTTLYSIVNTLNSPEINIVTIEDPVEIRIPGLNQVEIDTKTNFSDSLRTVLRQDPDIILVGEIRDSETAEIAMQAGQTGHYVLSTIHTINSIEVITRLRKIGISNYDIASTLATAVSQRLLRKICPNCSKMREFTEREKEIIYSIAEKYNVNFDLRGKTTFEADGCSYCNNTGCYDRIGVYEILNIDEKIKELILGNASSLEIEKVALSNGFRPLLVDGIEKVIDGIITLEELNRKFLFFN